MGGITSAAACAIACVVILSSCATKRDVLDLAQNPDLYHPTTYRAKVPVDRPAFLVPVVDDRGTVAIDEASGPYPTRWMAEGYWERSLPEMLGDCLHAALEDSAVVAGVQETAPPAPAALIVEPHLLDARTGQEEQVFGRRTLATVSVRLVVHGPTDAQGERPVLLDETFDQSVGTNVTPQPPRMPVMMGKAIEQVIARILARLDQSNVARTGVPMPVDAARDER